MKYSYIKNFPLGLYYIRNYDSKNLQIEIAEFFFQFLEIANLFIQLFKSQNFVSNTDLTTPLTKSLPKCILRRLGYINIQINKRNEVNIVKLSLRSGELISDFYAIITTILSSTSTNLIVIPKSFHFKI